MKTIKVDAEVTYYVSFECDVEVPDDFKPEDLEMMKGHSPLMVKIRDQITESAKEYDSQLEVDDVDWYIK